MDEMQTGITVEDVARLAGCGTWEAAERLGLPGASGRMVADPAAVRAALSGRGLDYAFRVVAHINMRGGIGKTTASIALAERAAQYGFRVCLLDLDSQGSATTAFGVAVEDEDPVFYDVWQKPEELAVAALRTVRPGLSLLPSSLQNGLLDSSLANPVSQKNAVRSTARVLREAGFDLVVVDCPPSLGAAVISAICAADTVVIPSGADAFSFKGIEMTMREVGAICETFGLETPDLRILYSRYDRREGLSIEALERLRRDYPEHILPEVIRTSADFNKALEKRATIWSAKAGSRAREDYDLYSRRILGLADRLVAPEAAAAPERPGNPGATQGLDA